MLIIPLLLIRCKKEKLDKTLDFGQFTIDVPANWTSFTSQGYDSKTGGIRNGQDELTYDYGWYSYDFRNETTSTHTRLTTTIHGKPALVVRPLTKGKGVVGAYVQVDSQYRFSMVGHDVTDEEIVMKIFRSVKFK